MYAVQTRLEAICVNWIENKSNIDIHKSSNGDDSKVIA